MGTSSPVDLLLGMFNFVIDRLSIFSFGTQKAAVTSSFLPLSATGYQYIMYARIHYLCIYVLIQVGMFECMYVHQL